MSSHEADRDGPEMDARWRVHADADNPTVIVSRDAFTRAVNSASTVNGDAFAGAAVDDATIVINRDAFARAFVDDSTIVINRDALAGFDDPALTGRPSVPDAGRGQIIVGDIPRQPPGFQPRADLLADLHRAGAGVAVLYAETGGRGVGKTQLAAAYARAKLAEGWRMVAWIDAGDIASALAGLATIVGFPGRPDRSSGRDPVDGGKALRQRLETDGDRCLIVFDNAADPDELRPYLPAHGAARVVIVSRRRSLTNLGANIPVGVFTAPEARAFLAARTGLADDAGASAVAAELKYLPLALAQAAAVISGQQLTYGMYLARLRAFPAREHLVRDQPRSYRVAEAVLLSLYEIRASDDGGVSIAIMELLAMLSPSGVYRDMIHAAGQAGVLSRHRRRSGVTAALADRALAVLEKWSLVTVSLDGRTVVTHPLIMQVIRNDLARQERLTAAGRAAAATLDGWAGKIEFTEDRAAIRDVTRQIKALLANAAGPAADADGELTRLLLSLRFWALYYLNELGGSASQAVALGQPLAEDFARALGADHPGTLAARNNLAAAYQAAGRLDVAIPLFEQTLAAREWLQGADQFSTTNSRMNLANAYREAGRMADAIPLFERALVIWERRLGADHPDTISARNDLASAYRAIGRR